MVNCNQITSDPAWYCAAIVIQFLEPLQSYVKSIWNPPADGHSGFSCIAKALAFTDTSYNRSFSWKRVRQECLHLLKQHRVFFETIWHGSDWVNKEFSRLSPHSVNGEGIVWQKGNWLSKLDTGPILANKYHRPIVFLSPGGDSNTIFPNWLPPPSQQASSQEPIVLGFVNGCHYIHIQLAPDEKGLFPMSPPLPGWEKTKQTALEVRRHYNSLYDKHFHCWNSLKKQHKDSWSL